jgi:hypothetical protein
MENKIKRYLDRVVEYMVSNTVIKNYLLNPTFRPIDTPIPIFDPNGIDDPYMVHYIKPLKKYLEEQFGLTYWEFKYVFKRYIDVMIDKYDQHHLDKFK